MKRMFVLLAILGAAFAVAAPMALAGGGNTVATCKANILAPQGASPPATSTFLLGRSATSSASFRATSPSRVMHLRLARRSTRTSS